MIYYMCPLILSVISGESAVAAKPDVVSCHCVNRATVDLQSLDDFVKDAGRD